MGPGPELLGPQAVDHQEHNLPGAGHATRGPGRQRRPVGVTQVVQEGGYDALEARPTEVRQDGGGRDIVHDSPP